jgi:glutamyl-tRNA reductase
LGGAVEAGRLSADVERRLRAEALAEAEAFASWLEVRSSGDSIAMLRAHGDEVRRRHLERLRLKSTLDEEQAAAVEAMTVAMFGELLHGPIVRLRHDPDAAAHVREVFGIE